MQLTEGAEYNKAFYSSRTDMTPDLCVCAFAVKASVKHSSFRNAQFVGFADDEPQVVVVVVVALHTLIHAPLRGNLSP